MKYTLSRQDMNSPERLERVLRDVHEKIGSLEASGKSTTADLQKAIDAAATTASTQAITDALKTSRVVATDIEAGQGNAFYVGSSSNDGSWRITMNGNNLVIQRREANKWITKSTISA